MSIPESVLREIERAIQAAEFPRGMSVHDGKAKVDSSHLRRLLAELAALRIENDALRAEREKLLGCRDELREIAEAISDSRIHNTMTIAEWCREASGD